MGPGPPRRRRARPVADAPVDALLLRAEDLAKGWLLAMVEQAPLDEAPSILAGDFTREGPRVCDAVVRALADDDDLRRLQPGGALERLVAGIGGFLGAGGADGVLRAVDALHGVVWAGLRAELSDPDGGLVAALAERLALVTELVRGAALRGVSEAGAVGSAAAGPVAPDALTPEPVPAEPVSPEPAAPEPVPEPAGGEARVRRIFERGPSGVGRPGPQTPDPEAGRAAQEALWIGAVEDEIRRAEETDAHLSLLLVELEDSDRVAAVESPREASATFGRFAQSLRSALRRQDILACETESRAWVIAPDTARPGAKALAERMADSVREAEPWRGAPLVVSVGVAVLGPDGSDASALIDAAEEAKFAASASGVTVVDDPGRGEPGGSGPRLVR